MTIVYIAIISFIAYATFKHFEEDESFKKMSIGEKVFELTKASIAGVIFFYIILFVGTVF